MKEIQELIDLRKKRILELKAFVDLHREKFPPLDRNSPPVVPTGSSLKPKVELTEDEHFFELFRLQLGDIEREVTESVAILNKLSYEMNSRVVYNDTSTKTLLEDFLTPLELEEVDKTVLRSTTMGKLNAIKLIKNFTRLGLKECKEIFETYHKIRFRGLSAGEKFNF